MIEAFEHVAIADFLRGGEAESCVIELEVVVSGLNLQRSASINGWSTSSAANRTRATGGGTVLTGKCAGSTGDEALRCREPEPAIVGAPCGGMAVGSHFACAKAVGRTELHPMRAAAVHVAVAARDAIGGSEPEVVLFVVEDGMDGGVAQARLTTGEKGWPSQRFHPWPCVPIRRVPFVRGRRAVMMLLERPLAAVKLDDGLGRRVRPEAGEAGESCNPQVAVCVAGHGADEIAAKSGGLGVGVDVAASACGVPVGEAAAGADPERVVSIEEEGADEIVGQAVGGGEGS